ncbi:ATP-binding protein [Acidomonas methanolica]|uniref:histidine kinase n=1 Tax=Acidomonas methanolica NBRC 104435 TaxID=1231351 RepID=A0A023D7C0_ACIMT|nr:ATP-binding protein [Acidomonas methanolica]MBU2652779.1 two-component sensor histidine kinase [Acidomonas methanolica]TCS31182.1 signal transduction histidine kinase [Acidomonas methanolica]GAJ30067.1 Integral membrane sensor hybrid histidine kinase [Acidomonas methanolica NBRC 104435]GBQ49169.1 hypothetical protein AA0498_0920 [Acidomonas methanolica]GEK98570.1 hypothetical protein AME01nite_10690 [Acidomonas methanolica NBRC 104435]
MTVGRMDHDTLSCERGSDDSATIDGVACAFAACTSREIRPTIRHALLELAKACGAQDVVLLARCHGLLLHVSPGAGDAMPLPPESCWVREVWASHRAAGPDDLHDLPDWAGAGGVVLARCLDHDRGCEQEESRAAMLVLRWTGRAAGDGERPFREVDGAIPPGTATLTRRIGALIASALRREDHAEERRALLRRLSERQNLDIASTTAVALAHNLNNVLAAMLGQTQIALDALRDQPRGYGAVMSIRNASERAAELIESILGFGQRDVPEEPVSMGRLAAETIELIRPAIPERIILLFEEREGDIVVHGRAAELQQILLNLLRNAAQAIGGDGRITTRIERRAGQPRLPMQIGALTDRSYMVLSVEDDGIGIDPALRAAIFRPFYTTRPAGSGLGLSAVADIVGAHDGAVRSLAAEQGGSVFEIWLPLGAADPRASSPSRGDGQCVVVVAPDAVRERFEDIVAALGYEPDGFGDVDAALDVLADDPCRCLAILLCTSGTDLDGCIVMAERFRLVPRAVPLTIAVPGRMPATLLGSIANRPTWLAGADNNSAIAACMGFMIDAADHSCEGATR